MSQKPLVLIISMGIAMAGLGFFAGTRYQANKQSQSQSQSKTRQSGSTNQPNPMANGAPNRQGSGLLSGEITSMDDQTLTLKLTDGSSKIIVISGSTTYQQTTPAQLSSLAVGGKITVVGADNTDGTTVAKTITIGETLPLPPNEGEAKPVPPTASTK